MTPQEKADAIRDRRNAPAQQTGAWVGNDGERLFLVRLYSDGTMTGAVKDLASNRYTPEVPLAPEAGWFESTPILTVVS